MAITPFPARFSISDVTINITANDPDLHLRASAEELLFTVPAGPADVELALQVGELPQLDSTDAVFGATGVWELHNHEGGKALLARIKGREHAALLDHDLRRGTVICPPYAVVDEGGQRSVGALEHPLLELLTYWHLTVAGGHPGALQRGCVRRAWVSVQRLVGGGEEHDE